MADEEVEKAVLCYVLTGKEFELSEEDFINQKHKAIIKAINELKAKKEEINVISVNNKIKDSIKNSLEYLADLGNFISFIGADTAYKMLKKYTKKRQLYILAQKMQKDIHEQEDVDLFAEKIINKIQKIEFQNQEEDTFVKQICKTIGDIEKNIGKEREYSYYTGFFGLDDLTDGLHEGELTVIGARPAVGKTTFALQILEYIASKGKKVALVSLEMSDTQLIQKILSRKTKINSRKFRNGDLTEEEIESIIKACSEESDLQISILTKVRTIQQIELEARRLKNRDKLDLLVIDYLQLVNNSGSFKSREQEVADISRTLKLLSLELEIPIIALCQLNRNASKNEPTLADIRESGAIEQDADNVIFLYRDDPESNIIVVDLQKQRSGNTGISKLKFSTATSEFINIER